METRKIVISRKGEFRLSKIAKDLYKKKIGAGNDFWYFDDIPRDDKDLVSVVEELGEAAGMYCELDIIEIPIDIDWEIVVVGCGVEVIVEKGKAWR